MEIDCCVKNRLMIKGHDLIPIYLSIYPWQPSSIHHTVASPALCKSCSIRCRWTRRVTIFPQRPHPPAPVIIQKDIVFYFFRKALSAVHRRHFLQKSYRDDLLESINALCLVRPIPVNEYSRSMAAGEDNLRGVPVFWPDFGSSRGGVHASFQTRDAASTPVQRRTTFGRRLLFPVVSTTQFFCQ